MIRRTIFIFTSLFALLFVSFGFSGCGTPIRDASPVSINPTVIRVKVNDVVSVQVNLSKAREKAATMSFIIDNPDILRPAAAQTSVDVAVGQDAVSFTFQGIKAGTTLLRARFADSEEIKADVVVVEQ